MFEKSLQRFYIDFCISCFFFFSFLDFTQDCLLWRFQARMISAWTLEEVTVATPLNVHRITSKTSNTKIDVNECRLTAERTTWIVCNDLWPTVTIFSRSSQCFRYHRSVIWIYSQWEVSVKLPKYRLHLSRASPLPAIITRRWFSGPHWAGTDSQFTLDLLSARAAQGVQPATKDTFQLRNSGWNQGVISLVRPIPGPQEIELQLTMKIYHSGVFVGSGVAKLLIHVSEFEY